MQIQVGLNYDHKTFRDDIRKCYWNAGVQNYPTVFLINESQIHNEQFLDDLSNMLNSGDVLNLFEGEDYEKVVLNSRQVLNELGKLQDQSEEEIFSLFISRVKSNLHVVICMNPSNSTFRERW